MLFIRICTALDQKRHIGEPVLRQSLWNKLFNEKILLVQVGLYIRKWKLVYHYQAIIRLKIKL